jgi:glycosyltransferase involved in cell wall biosynthesis
VTAAPAGSGLAPRPDLTVTTPWYPTPFNRMGGSFVAGYARLMTRFAGRVRVVHAQEWPGGKADDEATARLRDAFDDVTARMAASGGLTVTGAAGPVTRVPVFTLAGTTVPQRAEAMVNDVRRLCGPFDTPIVHGHVGYWGGLLAARLADPASAVFATEHSSGLAAVLADPAGRDHYAELLERATTVFCVSGHLKDAVLEVLPEYASTLDVLPNPVEFASVPHRDATPRALDRWVFVGAVAEHKGVERAARAFCAVARTNRRAEFTLFGSGPAEDAVRSIAADAGVADRVRLRGVVPHSQVLAELPEHDLLVAPSRYETFHLAVVEAVAAGLPVIVTRSGGPQESLRGVEDRVGRFVDVEDSPDQIVDAYRELSGALDSLDLAGARKELDARLGPDAVTARLARAYGCPAEAGTTASAGEAGGPAVPARLPERVVVVATSAWRRYSVTAELEAVRNSGVPAVVVTADPQVTAWSEGLPVVGPQGIGVPVEPLPSPAVRARRLAGRLKRRLEGRPAALPPRSARLSEDDLRGATVIVTDCQSMPVTRGLLDACPDARAVVELDRTGALGPLPDGAGTEGP